MTGRRIRITLGANEFCFQAVHAINHVYPSEYYEIGYEANLHDTTCRMCDYYCRLLKEVLQAKF